MPIVKVYPRTEVHFDEILTRLDHQCFPSDEIYQAGPQDHHWWIAFDEKRAVAFAGMRVDKNNRAFFCRAGVIKSHRGLGLHLALIRRRLSCCRRLGLDQAYTYTLFNNLASSKNLVRCGFHLSNYSTDRRLLWWTRQLT